MDAQLYKRRVQRAGTDLIYVSLDIDRASDGGWLTEGLMELFDEFYSRQTSADTLRSMIKTARSGHWCGGRVPLKSSTPKVARNATAITTSATHKDLPPA